MSVQPVFMLRTLPAGTVHNRHLNGSDPRFPPGDWTAASAHAEVN